ncbi:MAG: 7-cyano-7-deazaguanine synthase, partial [Oscillospiraceae bacterium]
MSDEICVGNSFSTYEQQDKVLVGMSGGVDSSVCVQILKDQGFLVEGVAIKFSPVHEKAVADATVVAKQMGVKLHVVECFDLFKEKVITPFCESYCQGTTPNPCVICNPYVKFKVLCDTADKLGINLIATGHYARVEEDDEGVFHICK